VRSPWYFRRRGVCFAVLSGVAFALGEAVARAAGTPFWSTPVVERLDRLVPAGAGRFGLAVVATLVAGGFALRVWGSAYLGKTIVWSREVAADGLRVAGPFRFTRNPLYLGTIVLVGGIALIGSPPAALAVVAVVAGFSRLLIAVEERDLQARFGAAFAAYARAVPRLLPVPGRAAPSSSDAGSLLVGLRTEMPMASFVIAAFAALALGDARSPAVLGVFLAGNLVHGAIRIRRRRA
jgi:hypothetical protein